jgi:hypothetical protein
MRLLFPLILITMLLTSGRSVNTRLNYDVIRNGNVIGYLHATRTSSGSQVDYVTES